MTEDLKDALAREARTLGFDCVAVTDPDAIAEAGRHFHEFLDAGAHGDMDWLAADPERRTDPRGRRAGVRSGNQRRLHERPDGHPLAGPAARPSAGLSG